MTVTKWPSDIHERTTDYALRVIRLFRHLRKQRDDVSSIIGRQFLRSATSIGANLTEAQSGESKADFIHKCSIAQKEAKESRYWLKLIIKANLVSASDLQPLLQETEELVAILTAIIVNTKKNARSKPIQNL
jgi:four helix bundle protein